MNQIEIWFSILARKLLKRASFISTEDLKGRLLAFVEYRRDGCRSGPRSPLGPLPPKPTPAGRSGGRRRRAYPGRIASPRPRPGPTRYSRESPLWERSRTFLRPVLPFGHKKTARARRVMLTEQSIDGGNTRIAASIIKCRPALRKGSPVRCSHIRCCRWSTILSVANRSGKMSVDERTDIEYQRTEPVTYLERSAGAILVDGGGRPAPGSK